MLDAEARLLERSVNPGLLVWSVRATRRAVKGARRALRENAELALALARALKRARVNEHGLNTLEWILLVGDGLTA